MVKLFQGSCRNGKMNFLKLLQSNSVERWTFFVRCRKREWGNKLREHRNHIVWNDPSITKLLTKNISPATNEDTSSSSRCWYTRCCCIQNTKGCIQKCSQWTAGRMDSGTTVLFLNPWFDSTQSLYHIYEYHDTDDVGVPPRSWRVLSNRMIQSSFASVDPSFVSSTPSMLFLTQYLIQQQQQWCCLASMTFLPSIDHDGDLVEWLYFYIVYIVEIIHEWWISPSIVFFYECSRTVDDFYTVRNINISIPQLGGEWFDCTTTSIDIYISHIIIYIYI